MRAALLGLLVLACAPPRRGGTGTECDRNSDCAAPLVCRIGYCRNECATSADCAAGQICLLDPAGFGACRLDREATCSLSSECPAGLVCRFSQCTNACETDRDCSGGARCEDGPDGRACIDRSGAPCAIDGDCDPEGLAGQPTRCIAGRCREECFADRDCRNDWWCDLGGSHRCRPPPRPDTGPPIDVGPPVDTSFDAAGLDVPIDGGGAPGTCSGGVLGIARRITRAGLDARTASATIASGHLVISTITDYAGGPGGELLVLDLSTGTWATPIPFPPGRAYMDTTSIGPVVYLTGGLWSTPGGDEHTDVATFDVGSSTLGALGVSTVEGRTFAGTVACGTRVVVAGGDPSNTSGSGSLIVDVFDTEMPALSIPTSLSDRYTGLGAAATDTHAYFAGGLLNGNLGNDHPSQVMFAVECATGLMTESPTPHAMASGAMVRIDRALYLTGWHYGDTTVFPSAPSTFDVVDVYDLDTGSWATIGAPPPTMTGRTLLAQIATDGTHLVRAIGPELQVLDVTTGAWRCTTLGQNVVHLVSDGTAVYAISGLGTMTFVDELTL